MLGEVRLLKEWRSSQARGGRKAVWRRTLLAGAVALALAFALARFGYGQAAQYASAREAKTGSDKTPVFRVHRLVVNVPVTVLDKRGEPVIDLPEKDFRIYEDGQRQQIAYFRQEPLPPLRIGLVLDTSNAMKMQMKYEKDAASQFVYNILQGQNTNNEIFLETFDESSNLIQPFTSDPDLLNRKITTLKAGGGKALYDAIYSACADVLLKAGNPELTRRVLVVVSDGIDVQSKHTLDEAVSMAHRAEASIYVIGNSPYGYSNTGDRYLDDMADETGGWAFFPLEQQVGTDLLTGYLAHGQMDPDGSQNVGLGARTGIYSAEKLEHLANALENLGRQLDSQYSIGYTPADQKLDGAYRHIRVVVRLKGAKVRYKRGYFALAHPS
jgi:Ca-activated chloride channel homolog